MNEVGEYKAWLLRSASSEGIALKAESIAYETLRRMSSVITRAGMADEEAFRQGITLADGLACLPAGLAILEKRDTAIVTLREGKYHQIKRMMERVGVRVTALERLSFGPLVLDPALERGRWRPLTPGEEAALGALATPAERV